LSGDEDNSRKMKEAALRSERRLVLSLMGMASESWVYSNDALDRLVNSDNQGNDSLDQSWSYDLAGNMLTNSGSGLYVYPGQGAGTVRPHTPISVNGEGLSYDANGNLANRGAKSYAYDAENRLTSVNASAFFAYGPDGERVRKSDGLSSTIYLGNDIEYAGGLYTKYLHPENGPLILLNQSRSPGRLKLPPPQWSGASSQGMQASPRSARFCARPAVWRS
jgi:hypothetical protein